MHRFVFAVCLFTATSAYAQQQSPAPAAPTQASLVDTLTSAPIIGQAGVGISAGGTFQSGRTDARDWTTDVIVAHTTSNRTLLRFEGELDVQHHRPSGAGRYLEVEDNHVVSALVMKPVHKRLSIVGLGTWRRDAVLQLDHRLAVGGGIGLHLVDTARTHLLVIPLFAVGDESRKHTERFEKVADAGFIQTFAAQINERLIVEQSVKASVDTTELDDHIVRLDGSVSSELVRRLTLKLYVQMQRDAIAPPGQDRLQTKTGVALQVAFARRR